MSGYPQSGRPNRPSTEAKLTVVGVIFAVFAASAHVYQFAIEWKFLGRAMEVGILTSSSFALLQVFFILSFLACAIGLLMRNLPGIIISILGLVGVLLGYTYWYSYSSRWLTGLKKDVFYTEHLEFVPAQSFGLVGAHWWDVAILALAAALLILTFTKLIRLRQTK